MLCRNVGSANQIAEILISARADKKCETTQYACSFDLANRSMADSEVRISKAISYATKALGYSELRPNQELAVKNFLRGHDVFVSLPTGSGKSLCYCLLPKAFDFLWQRIESTQSILVVVSPLIALMQDQVRAMRE